MTSRQCGIHDCTVLKLGHSDRCVRVYTADRMSSAKLSVDVQGPGFKVGYLRSARHHASRTGHRPTKFLISMIILGVIIWQSALGTAGMSLSQALVSIHQLLP